MHLRPAMPFGVFYAICGEVRDVLDGMPTIVSNAFCPDVPASSDQSWWSWHVSLGRAGPGFDVSLHVQACQRAAVDLVPAMVESFAPRPDATDGEADNPGPRPQALPLHQRPNVDLQRRHRILGPERRQRDRARSSFAAFLALRSRMPLDTFLEAPDAYTNELDGWAKEFGQYLYDTGRPIGILVHLVLALEDAAPYLKKRLPKAADAIATWRGLMPAGHHLACPFKLWLALIALALCWGWCDVAIGLTLLFSGMLRPADYFGLVWGDLRTPDVYMGPSCHFVDLTHKPNMRWLHARR